LKQRISVYNFSIPASLKAWIDLISRARKTFRYTEDGPEGLLKGKKAYILLASGGTKAGSEIDFATPYLKHALKFVGIEDVTIIAADAQGARGADALIEAKEAISDLAA
jgi:FMN-dependent NADH-azoreductase